MLFRDVTRMASIVTIAILLDSTYCLSCTVSSVYYFYVLLTYSWHWYHSLLLYPCCLLTFVLTRIHFFNIIFCFIGCGCDAHIKTSLRSWYAHHNSYTLFYHWQFQSCQVTQAGDVWRSCYVTAKFPWACPGLEPPLYSICTAIVIG